MALALVLAVGLMAAGCAPRVKLEFSHLRVESKGQLAGSRVAISAEVVNTGWGVGRETIALTIDGEVVNTTDVRMGPGETAAVTFEIATGAPGTYTVGLGGLEGSFSFSSGPEQVVSSAAERMAGLESFHFELDHERGVIPLGGGLEMVLAVGDVVVPDRMLALVSGTAGDGPATVWLRREGSDVYLSDSLLPQRWRVLTGGPFDPYAGTLALLREVTGLVPAGESAIGDSPVYHLVGQVAASVLEPIVGNALPDSKVEVGLWLNMQDFRLHLVKLEGPATAEDEEDTVRWLRFSRFNRGVNIELPE